MPIINDLGCGWVLVAFAIAWGVTRMAELSFLHSQKMQELRDNRDVALLEAQSKGEKE